MIYIWMLNQSFLFLKLSTFRSSTLLLLNYYKGNLNIAIMNYFFDTSFFDSLEQSKQIFVL